jgi:3-hydroxyacyl-CoA dehydrogenase
MPEVAIIGAGLIGRAWTIVFARAGWNVRVWDPVAEARGAAPGLLRASMEDLHARDLLGDVDSALARVAICDSLPSAVAGADLVQENGPEIVDLKRTVFRELDRHAKPGAILASSSSAIVASLFTEGLAGAARCIIAHPVNPPHLIPVVELCGSPWTSTETIARAREIYEAVGQTPVVVNRELEGFVLNRLQGALLAEAFRLVGEGVISPSDLDKTVKDGLGLRWSFMGPFETIDLNAPGGIDDYCTRYTGFYRRLSEDSAPPEVWDRPNIEKILAAWGEPAGGETRQTRSERRDRRLAALLVHKKESGEPGR